MKLPVMIPKLKCYLHLYFIDNMYYMAISLISKRYVSIFYKDISLQSNIVSEKPFEMNHNFWLQNFYENEIWLQSWNIFFRNETTKIMWNYSKMSFIFGEYNCSFLRLVDGKEHDIWFVMSFKYLGCANVERNNYNKNP